MPIIVNGLEREYRPGQSLRNLITSMNLDPAVVVAELNRDIVPGADFDSTILRDGDNLELLSFVGGG